MKLKIKILILAVVILGFSYYTIRESSKNSYSVPTVFYFKSAIEEFDEAGNLYGYKKIIKVRDIVNHQEIYTSNKKESLYNFESSKFIDNKIYLDIEQSEDKKEIKILDEFGKVTKTLVIDSFVYLTDVLESPNSQYLAFIESVNIQDDSGDPGITEYTLKIKDNNQEEVVSLKPEEFKYKEEGKYGNFMLSSFDSKNEKLYVELFSSTQGDPMPSAIFGIDLTTGKNNMIISSDEKFYTVHYFGTNTDKSELYILKRDMWSGENEVLVYDVLTKKIKKLFKSDSEPVENSIHPDKNGLILYQDDYNFSYYDLRTGKEKVFNGEFKSWSSDGNFIIYKLAESMADMYYGPYRLILHDINTGEEKTIYEQSVYNSGYNTNTKVGDVVYEFIGIQ